jgi:cellulose synthase/poly-beta-1,6-N-acetylglucosamine synthase-like glycosyltransferase
MSFLFLVCLAFLLHTYLGYPLSLLLLRLIRGDRSRHLRGDGVPSVTLVISAYNEEAVIRRKVENSLALDYPQDRIARIVVSDGSTDATDAIVREYEGRGVELRSFPGRRGKVACLNDVLPSVRSDLVVLSDANSMYDAASLRRLAEHFADPRVGCVCGLLRYVNPRRLAAGRGERVYWGYEGIIKRLESSLGSLLGANGAIYAFRPGLFRTVDPLTFCDDVIPIRVAIEGRLVLFDPQAACTEEAVDEDVERRRRRRHASFGMRSMMLVGREAARRGRLLVLYQCLSHRMLRWLGGVFLAGLLVSSPSLPPPWAALALGAQGLLYGGALMGFLTRRRRRGSVLPYLPYYFLVITLAGLRGLAAHLVRSDRPYWEPRQSPPRRGDRTDGLP